MKLFAILLLIASFPLRAESERVAELSLQARDRADALSSQAQTEAWRSSEYERDAYFKLSHAALDTSHDADTLAEAASGESDGEVSEAWQNLKMTVARLHSAYEQLDMFESTLEIDHLMMLLDQKVQEIAEEME